MCTYTLALTLLLRVYLKCIKSAVGSKPQAVADFCLMPLEATGTERKKISGLKGNISCIDDSEIFNPIHQINFKRIVTIKVQNSSPSPQVLTFDGQNQIIQNIGNYLIFYVATPIKLYSLYLWGKNPQLH